MDASLDEEEKHMQLDTSTPLHSQPESDHEADVLTDLMDTALSPLTSKGKGQSSQELTVEVDIYADEDFLDI